MCIRDSSCILSDDELRALPERYACSARLAEEAGFDGVDIKACHRYLLNELLSAHTRPGPYGGSFENRTRLLRDAVRAAKAATAGGAFISSRLNVYDGFPYPYGWGAVSYTHLDVYKRQHWTSAGSSRFPGRFCG